LGASELALEPQPRLPHLFEQLWRHGVEGRTALVCGATANNINPDTGVKDCLVSDGDTPLAFAYTGPSQLQDRDIWEDLDVFWKGSHFTRQPGPESFISKIKDTIHRKYLPAPPVIQF